MAARAEFSAALAAGDIERCRQLWAGAFPQMPQPKDDEAELVMHTARTASKSVRLEKRLYSHAWLNERGFRSELPDQLRPDPLMPRIVPAVMVSINTASKRLDRIEECAEIERVMSEAVGNAMADCLDDKAVSKVMWAARRDFLARRI